MIKDCDIQNLPADKREDALRKLGIIHRFEKFSIEHIRNGGNRMEALSKYAVQTGVSERTITRWIMRYHQQGLLSLVDSRGGNPDVEEKISPDVFELFKSMYLTQQRLTIKTCWQNINYINQSQNRGWKIPGLRGMYRYIEKHLPLPFQILHREGLTAYEAKCAPYIEIDPDSIEPNQVWVGDHSQFNCWVRYQNKWVRPWVTAWEDLKSRMIVGWYLSLVPNQTTILLSMKQAIEKFGPPESAKIDNGRDYDSEMFTGTTKMQRKSLRKGYLDEQMLAGIYTMLDIAVSFAIPYNAKAKRIERLFDTIDTQFSKTFDLYCGKDTRRKPEDLVDKLKNPATIREAITFEKFISLFASYVEVYNSNSHSAKDMQEQSPDEVFQSRRIHRVLAAGVVDLLMRVWSRELTVGKNGVQFKGIYYGQYNSELLVHHGQKVKLSYDPNDLRKVYVYDAVTFKLITIAEQNQLVSYGAAISEDSLRNAMREKRRVLRVAKDFRNSELTRNMDLTTLTIKAMQDVEKQRAKNKRQKAEDGEQRILRPVKTLLDDQVKEHQRQEIVQALKKAVGAESIKSTLDFDFSLLKSNRSNRVRLFDE
jgi:putative transposase